ncbi:PISD family protein [Megaselia abdita]
MVSYLVPRNRLFSKCNIRHAPVRSGASTESNRWIAWSTFRQKSNSSNDKHHHIQVEKIVQKNQIKQNKEEQQHYYPAALKRRRFNEWFTWPALFFRWGPMGVCILGALEWQYRQYDCDKQQKPRTASNLQTIVYCSLPLRFVSRCWGWLADCYVPINLRPYVYGFYSSTFKVKLEEAAIPDFKHYRSIAEFFTRPLREGARIISESNLVSPADGKVLHIGCVDKSLVEQVKGISYRIDSFLGPETWTDKLIESDLFENKIKINKSSDTSLYQCIIYLAPGDYHRFHSPTKWEPTLRRHFPGELLSVNPKIAKWLPGLFCVNERAVYVGKWQYGFFSYTAVGATNVGSVQIFIDEKLKTNQYLGLKPIINAQYDDLRITNQSFDKGELIGQFNMGSTIVLLFEAPKNFNFTVEPGQTVSVGQSIGQFS